MQPLVEMGHQEDGGKVGSEGYRGRALRYNNPGGGL